MNVKNYREIPYNFTSADDKLIINLFFGPEVWDDLEELRSQRITGRSARLVMRFMGDLFILRTKPLSLSGTDRLAAPTAAFIRHRRRRSGDHRRGCPDRQGRFGTQRQGPASGGICRDRLAALKQEIHDAPAVRSQMQKKLGAVIGKDNVRFDPFTLISHATDATDWRLFLPLAVLRPSTEEQLPGLMQAVAELGLKIIPRGGGTGLTGGSVPVTNNCVIFNTEKLTTIHDIVPAGLCPSRAGRQGPGAEGRGRGRHLRRHGLRHPA